MTTTAESLAASAHAGQTYNGRPYVEHCRDVVAILDRYGYVDLLDAGWLHDAIEDTDLTREDITRAVGWSTASLVWACTGVGANRRERNACIAERLADIPTAVPIKVADRIANVASCWANRDARLFMYHREYREFRAVVAGHVDRAMLAELDALMAWRS